MSSREPVLNRAMDAVVVLCRRIRTSTGAFFDYAAVYDGWAPDPCESPAILLLLGDIVPQERSSGLEQDAVVVWRGSVALEARQVLLVQEDLPPRTVAIRMLCDLQGGVVGEHELGGAAINVSLVNARFQIDGDSEVEVVVRLELDVVYQTRLTDPTRES